MFKNYLKIAFKVLLRRKFFSFISLFGIAFTLVVLMAFTAIMDHVFHPDGPERLNERMLGVYSIVIRSPERNRISSGNPGYRFLDRYVRTLTTPESVSICSEPTPVDSYLNGTKITSRLRRTDGIYWSIFKFDFIEGQAFTQADEDQARQVAVINETTRQRFFGAGPALGQFIEFDRQQLRVVGVVRNVSVLHFNAEADIWAPLSTDHTSGYRESMRGGMTALVLARSRADFAKIKAEYRDQLGRVVFPDPKKYNYIAGGLDTKLERMAREVFNEQEESEASTGQLLIVIVVLMLLFMLLPAVNLININISRIMERASEIGVRKAFGASSRHLIMQFLLENLVLTLLGGLLGLAGAYLVLEAITQSGIVQHAVFRVNARVFAYAMVLIGVFGIFSGVLPAWKMSRLNPVTALKGSSS